MTELISAGVSALVQLIVLAVIPLIGFVLFLRFRYRQHTVEALRKAGLQVGERRYLYLSAGIAVLVCALITTIFVVVQPATDSLTRSGTALHAFLGLGLGRSALVLALLYGVVKTGLVEELLFRGLIAGALSRRMTLANANLLQALIFLLPHLLLLLVVPELWPLLPLVFVLGLLLGWLRIRSGSILGPWMVHAAGNVTMALAIAAQTAP